jgi:hypothetical protein
MICQECSQRYEVLPDHQAYYDQIQVPAPRSCPDCRLIRRLNERNTRSLYYRKCDSSGKAIISMYHPEQPFPVYDQEVWWGDSWDDLATGRDFDFNRSFFEQFQELKNVTPHPSVFIVGGTLENSEFTNCVGYLKNCYLISESDYDEDCYYSNRIYHSKNLCDCTNGYEMENCYECIDCMKCFNLAYSQESQNCSDSFFLKNCLGCKDCIGCMNQRQKQYMIYNVQYSKEEYEEKKAAMDLHTHSGQERVQKESEAFWLTQSHKATEGEHNENVMGDHVYNSKNSTHCYDCKDLEDCHYVTKCASQVKNCMDYTAWGFKAELVYQSSACGDNAYDLKFCSTCTTNNSRLEYCYQMTGSQDCFGCSGLKKKRFCIFNKQYSEEEYHELKAKIISHMKESGEYGEFFPKSFSSFGYNEALVMDHFPMTKEQAISKGYKWSDYESPIPQVDRTIPADKLPESISDIPDDVLNWGITCEITGKIFKVTQQELEFYRRMNIPLPKKHPDIRHQDRMKKRPPWKLFDRSCSTCQRSVKSTFASDRMEKVVCEECYLKEVY